MNDQMQPLNNKHKRGFASMNPERRREICSEGGKAVHAKGKAYEWTTETARIAGRKGGLITASKTRKSNAI